MDNDAASEIQRQPKRRYTWPWFVLAAVLLAVALAILWMRYEIERIERTRDSNALPPQNLK